MIKSALYSTRATSTGGRTGTSKSEDGRLDVVLDTPKALGGNDGPGTNPEQLFAAGYSACFLSALKSVASQQKIKLSEDTAITASVDLGQNADGPGFAIGVALEASLPGIDQETAEKLVETAHQVCPYSNATRGNVEVKLSVRAA